MKTAKELIIEALSVPPPAPPPGLETLLSVLTTAANAHREQERTRVAGLSSLQLLRYAAEGCRTFGTSVIRATDLQLTVGTPVGAEQDIQYVRRCMGLFAEAYLAALRELGS